MASTNPESQTNEANANLTYKDQLDETASKVKYGNQNNGKGEGGFVNQVAEKGRQAGISVALYVKPLIGNCFIKLTHWDD